MKQNVGTKQQTLYLHEQGSRSYNNKMFVEEEVL